MEAGKQGRTETQVRFREPAKFLLCLVLLRALCALGGEMFFRLVEPMGFEPTTSSMPSRRAPNCATAPPKVAMLKNCSTLAACGQTPNKQLKAGAAKRRWPSAAMNDLTRI